MKLDNASSMFLFTTMTSLVIGDSHVNRLRQFTRFSRHPHNVFNISELPTVTYYCELVTSNHHLRKFCSIVQSTRTHNLIVLLGSNDLDSVKLIVTNLVSFATQRHHLKPLQFSVIFRGNVQDFYHQNSTVLE